MKNIFYQIVSFGAVGLYFVPMLIVFFKKLWPLRPFRLFALYWLLSGLVNLVEFIPLSKTALELYTVIYNMLDIPIIMGVFYFTTSAPGVKKFTRVAIPALIGVEGVNCMVQGLHYQMLKYNLALGLIMVLTIIVWEIIVKLQKIRHTGTEKGLLFIYAALLFEYGTFVVIYIFDYLLPGVSSSADNFFVYYLSSAIALAVAICGFLIKGIHIPPPTDRQESFYNRNIPDFAFHEELE